MGVFRKSMPILVHDRPYAFAAASWVEASNHGVIVRVLGDCAEICGPKRESELARCWQAALINERLLTSSKAQRAAILESLLA